jgi:hypothetical protein
VVFGVELGEGPGEGMGCCGEKEIRLGVAMEEMVGWRSGIERSASPSQLSELKSARSNTVGGCSPPPMCQYGVIVVEI